MPRVSSPSHVSNVMSKGIKSGWLAQSPCEATGEAGVVSDPLVPLKM